MIDKPYDIVVIATIFGVVFLTIGFGVRDVATYKSTTNPTFYASIIGNYSDGVSALGTDSLTDSLSAQNGSTVVSDSENLITQGYKSFMGLGKTWSILKNSLFAATESIGIDPSYVLLLTSALVSMIIVVLYTWIRGR